jgi:hypothetical protein
MLAENKDRNQVARPAQKGEIIGVWGTPGNADLNRLQGCLVWLKKKDPKDFIDTGKGNPMKTYHMKYTGEGKPVQVLSFTEPVDSHMGTPPDVGTIPF